MTDFKQCLENLPSFHREAIEKLINPLNPNIDLANQLNFLNIRLAQTVSLKRIKFRMTPGQKPVIVNLYGLILINSGGGKDRLNDIIDKYLLADFKTHFKKLDKEFLEKFLKENKESIDKDTIKAIRNLRCEIGDGTAEGFFSDCVAICYRPFGGIFVLIPEFAAYIENPTQAQQIFLNSLIEVYEGKVSSKSIKSELIASEVEGVHVNILFYSDPSRLLNGKAGKRLEEMLDAGLSRRFFVTCMVEVVLSIIEDPQREREITENAYKDGVILGKKLMEILEKIPENAIYQLNDEAYAIFHNYKNNNIKKYNLMLKTSESIIKKELLGRDWKTLKLAALIAAIEHPEQTVITAQDMKYAIFQSELFAESAGKFFEMTPVIDAQKLYNYFKENKGAWLTKTDIRQQKFVSQKGFSSWFKENIELAREIAVLEGCEITEEAFGGYTKNSGTHYKLVASEIGKELSPEVQDTKELL